MNVARLALKQYEVAAREFQRGFWDARLWRKSHPQSLQGVLVVVSVCAAHSHLDDPRKATANQCEELETRHSRHVEVGKDYVRHGLSQLQKSPKPSSAAVTLYPSASSNMATLSRTLRSSSTTRTWRFKGGAIAHLAGESRRKQFSIRSSCVSGQNWTSIQEGSSRILPKVVTAPDATRAGRLSSFDQMYWSLRTKITQNKIRAKAVAPV
jgi:hypothetical protein